MFSQKISGSLTKILSDNCVNQNVFTFLRSLQSVNYYLFFLWEHVNYYCYHNHFLFPHLLICTLCWIPRTSEIEMGSKDPIGIICYFYIIARWSCCNCIQTLSLHISELATVIGISNISKKTCFSTTSFTAEMATTHLSPCVITIRFRVVNLSTPINFGSITR